MNLEATKFAHAMKSSLAAAGAALLLATACSPFPKPRTQYQDPHTPQVAMKRVIDKRAPVYLVAYDHTECTVAEKRFQKVKIGDVVLCAWQTPP